MGTIASTDFSIRGDTLLDSSGLSSGLNALTVAAGNLLSGLVSKVAEATASAAKYAVNVGSSFDTAMSQVAATMGTTVDQIQDLGDKAREMGATTAFTATQAAEGLNILAMAGLDAADQIASIGTVLDLASAGALSLESSASYVTGTVKGFADEMSNAQYYADLMAKGATLANTSVAGLGEALSGSAASVSAYGQTAESTTLALLRLAEQNVTGSEAATALSRAMMDLYTPTSNAADALEALGVSAYTSTGEAKDFNELVDELSAALAGYSAEEANALKNTIFTTYGLQAFNKMTVSSVETVEKFRDGLADAFGSAAQQAATQLDNLQGDLTLFSSATDGLMMAVYDTFSTYLRDIVQLGTSFVGQLQTALETDGPAGMAAAAAQIVGGLVQGFAEQLPALLDQGTQAAVSLIDSMVEGIQQALPTFLAQALPMLVSFTGSLRENAGKLVDAGLALIQSLADGLIESLPVLIANVPVIVSNIAGVINDNAPKLLAAGATLIAKLAKGLIDSIPTLVQNLPQIITAIVDVITAFNWLDLGKTIVTGIKNGITGMVSSITQSAQNLAQNVNDIIHNWGWQTLGKSVVESLKLGIEALKDTLPNLFKLICENIKKKFAAFDWVGLGKNIIEGIAGGITGSLKGLLDTVGDMASGILNKVKDVLGIHSPSKEFASIGVNVVQGLVNGILTSTQQVEAAAKQLAIDTADAYVEEAEKQLEAAQEQLSKATTKAAKKAAQAAVDAAKATLKEAQEQAAADQELADDLERIAAGLGEDTGIGFVSSLVSAVKSQDWTSVAALVAQGIFSRLTAEQQTAITGWVASAVEQLNAGFAEDGLAGLVQAGASLVQGLTTGLQTNSGTLLSAAQALVGNLQTAFHTGFQAIASTAGSLVNSLQSVVTGGLQNIVSAAGTLLGSFQTIAANSFGNVLSAGSTLVQGLQAVVTGGLQPTSTAASLLGSVMNVLSPIISVASQAMSVLNGVLSSNPILFVVSAVAALVTALIGLSKTNSTVGSGFAKVWKGIKSVFDFIIDGILAALGVLVQGFVTAINACIAVYNAIPLLPDIGYVSNPFFNALEERQAQRAKEDAQIAEQEKQLEQSGDIAELEVPDIEAPEITIPEVEVPEIEVPEIEVPEIDLPDIDLPDAETGDDLSDAANDLTDAIEDQTEATKEAIASTQDALAEMVRQAKSLVLSDNMAIASRVADNGSARTAQLAAAYQTANSAPQAASGRTTTVVQNIYSKAQTAADLARETRWEYDRAART